MRQTLCPECSEELQICNEFFVLTATPTLASFEVCLECGALMGYTIEGDEELDDLSDTEILTLFHDMRKDLADIRCLIETADVLSVLPAGSVQTAVAPIDNNKGYEGQPVHYETVIERCDGSVDYAFSETLAEAALVHHGKKRDLARAQQLKLSLVTKAPDEEV